MGDSNQQIKKEIVISISALNKWYGDLHVLKDVDLDVEKGERIVIAGPSGSGKSTLIRCINALEKYQGGNIAVNGVELADDVLHERGFTGSGGAGEGKAFATV